MQSSSLQGHLEQMNAGDKIKQCIQNISNKPKHQTKVIILLLLIATFYNFQAYGSIRFYMNPVFQCEGMEQKVTEDQACLRMNSCKMINQQTIAAELNLYCGQGKNERVLLQTGNGFGYWAGIMIVSLISDRKGRKFCLCIGMVLLNLTCLFQYIGSNIRNVPLLFASQFISGLSNVLVYLNFLILLTRFMSKNWYEGGTLGWLLAGNGVAPIIISTLDLVFNNWRILLYIYSFGIFILTIAVFTILWEDPIYLFDVGNIQEAKRVILGIGEQNDVDHQQNEENLQKINHFFNVRIAQDMSKLQNSEVVNNFSYLQICKCDIVTKILVIGAVYFFYSLANMSITMSIQNLQYSYDFNLIIVGLANIIGYSTAIYIIRVEQQRKRGIIYSSFIYCLIAFLFVFPFCYQNGIIETIVIFFLRLLLCWIYNFNVRLNVDSFPSKYQLTSMSIAQFIGNFSVIAGPYLIQTAIKVQFNPIFFISALYLIFGILPLYFLIQKNTKKSSINSQV